MLPAFLATVTMPSPYVTPATQIISDEVFRLKDDKDRAYSVEHNGSFFTLDLSDYYSQRKHDESFARVFNTVVESAVTRMKHIYKVDTYDITPAQKFLDVLQTLNCRFSTYSLAFFPDGAKARFRFGKYDREFVADYDYEDTSSVFVSAFVDEVLVVKECEPDKLLETLESYQ